MSKASCLSAMLRAVINERLSGSSFVSINMSKCENRGLQIDNMLTEMLQHCPKLRRKRDHNGRRRTDLPPSIRTLELNIRLDYHRCGRGKAVQLGGLYSRLVRLQAVERARAGRSEALGLLE